jgi:hypothetical protein
MNIHSVELALALSKIVHDRCKDVPHDIGLILAKEVERHLSEPNEQAKWQKITDIDDDGWPQEPALEYKIPIGTLACPHCGVVVSGAIDPICGWCERPYWDTDN